MSTKETSVPLLKIDFSFVEMTDEFQTDPPPEQELGSGYTTRNDLPDRINPIFMLGLHQAGAEAGHEFFILCYFAPVFW